MTTALQAGPSEIARSLRCCSIPEMSQIRVRESDTTVLLEGCLPSFYFKSLAQEMARPHLDGRRLVNRIQVA